MTDNPIVDVLIPVYNGEAFIRSSITSILAQTVTNINVHVVNDGSTDGTEAILEEMSAAERRIKVYRKSNGGIVDALNFGLSFCKAPYIARHDADDLAYPDRLASQLALLEQRPEVVATGSSARHIDAQGEPMGTVAVTDPTEHADPMRIPAREPYLLHPFLMMRRKTLASIGGYRHVLHAEDADLYWRLQERGELLNDSRILGDYRMHPSSISSQSINNGRIMAASSQLCALSASRRRADKPDLIFSRDDALRLKEAAGSLHEICAVAVKTLCGDEARHLRFATAMKLLEMADYRYYEPNMADCLFVRQMFDECSGALAPDNLAHARRIIVGTAARLAGLGKWNEARLLSRVDSSRQFWSRYLLRRILPASAHRRLRRLAGTAVKLLRGASITGSPA